MAFSLRSFLLSQAAKKKTDEEAVAKDGKAAVEQKLGSSELAYRFADLTLVAEVGRGASKKVTQVLWKKQRLALLQPLIDIAQLTKAQASRLCTVRLRLSLFVYVWFWLGWMGLG